VNGAGLWLHWDLTSKGKEMQSTIFLKKRKKCNLNDHSKPVRRQGYLNIALDGPKKEDF
jgi:hypothetical protein